VSELVNAQPGWENTMLEEWVSSRHAELSEIARAGVTRWGQGAVVADGTKLAFMPTAALAAELAKFPDLMTEVLHRVSACPPDRGVLLVASTVAGGVRGNSWVAEYPLDTRS
jgi:hypothetical protein